MWYYGIASRSLGPIELHILDELGSSPKSGTKMTNDEGYMFTKKQLIDAMESYPDDAPIVLAVGSSARNLEANGWGGTDYCNVEFYGVSADPDVIRLEL